MTKKELGIIKKGFSPLYIKYLEEICNHNKINFVIFENTPTDEVISQFDYIISDTQCLPKYCNIVHSFPKLYRDEQYPNKLYGNLLKIHHLPDHFKNAQVFKSSSKIVVVSSLIKDYIVKAYKIAPEKIVVAYPGKGECSGDEFKTFDYASDIFTIGISAVGFVSKGGYILLDALKEFKKLFPNVRIKAKIIYPNYEKNLAVKLYLKSCGLGDIVEILGYQKNIGEFYKKCHCFICPSLFEAFGRVVPEAMSTHRPVIIGSKVGAIDIIKDGINGYVFEMDKYSNRNLALKIKEVYDKYNSLEDLTQSGYETSNNLTWRNFAYQVIKGLYPEEKIILSEE